MKNTTPEESNRLFNRNQTTTITVEFKVKHNPGTENHLKEVIHNHLKGKGVKIEDDKIIC